MKATQRCSIARTAEIIGDRWVILVLRELFGGAARFGDLARRTGAATNILTARLNGLVDARIVARSAAGYELTDRGRALFPIVLAIMAWGDAHEADGDGPPVLLRHRACGAITTPGVLCSSCGTAVEPGQLVREHVPLRA